MLESHHTSVGSNHQWLLETHSNSRLMEPQPHPARQSLPQYPRPVPRARRQKIHLACNNCRDRKTRCDGGRPVCAACRRRDVASTCFYERNPVAARRYTASSESQVRRLEQPDQIQPTEQPDLTSDETNQDIRLDASQSGQTFPWTPNGAPAPSNHGSALGNRSSTQSHGPLHVDALATISSEDNDNCLYGESSTIAFVRQVTQGTRAEDATRVMSDRESQTVGDSAQSDQHIGLLPLDMSLGKNENLSVLPLRRSADDFLHCFWEFVHPLFPLIHKTSFTEQYEKLWLPDTPPMSNEAEVIFMSSLNLIFALGCQFSDRVPGTQKVSAANEFYKKSRHVLLYDILGSISVPVVQWLLLSGVYLQSTSRASHCWSSIGLAIRLAQGLGLHLERSEGRSMNQLNREMRRRIWHTCLVLDRLLAMTFGRPVMVNKSYSTPIPTLIDDEYLRSEGEGVQPPDVPSHLGLFISSCTLFEILADILSSFYAGNTGTKIDFESSSCVPNMILEVLNFNRRLDSFITAIPEYLKTTRSAQLSMNEKNSYINLQQQVLYCRFLYTRLLSLRPLLLMTTNRQNNTAPTPESVQANLSSFDDDFVKRSCTLCIGTAHRLIETIHQHLDTTYKSTGWHSVYFTFASATILLASMKLPEPERNTEESFETSWSRCLSIMRHYEDQIHTAPYAIQVLETLRRQIQGPNFRDPQSEINNGGFVAEHLDRNEVNSPQIPLDAGTFSLELSQFNPYGIDSLSEAWFGQHIINLDGMNLGQMFS